MGRQRPDRIAAVCAALGLGGLAALGVAYWFTYEPAPGIRVTWAAAVGEAERAALERRYQLANRRGADEDVPPSLAYDLLDTRASNIEALLNDPAVIDTNDLDDEYFRVRLGTAYGDEWMWIAHRIPGLRDGRVRAAVLVLLTALSLFGLGRLLRRRDPAASG